MANGSVAIDGYVHVTKDYPEYVRGAVLNLLVQKFPEKHSEEQIRDFVEQCRFALKIADSPTPKS